MLSKTRKISNFHFNQIEKKIPSCTASFILKLEKCWTEDLLEFNFNVCRNCPGRVFHTHALHAHSPNHPDLKCARYPVLWGCAVFISAMGALRGFWFTLDNLRWNCWEVLKRNTVFPYARNNNKPHYVHYPCSASILRDCKDCSHKGLLCKGHFKIAFALENLISSSISPNCNHIIADATAYSNPLYSILCS